jgi:diguanylate cyclase (GGDEF)-like protein
MSWRAAKASLRATLTVKPIRRLLITGVLFSLAAVATAVAVGSHFRERALHESEREHQNVVLLLAEHLAQLLQRLDAAERDVESWLAYPSHLALDRLAVHRLLQSKSAELAHVSRLTLVDAEGRLLNTSDEYLAQHRNAAAHAFIQDLKTAGRDWLLTSPVVTATGLTMVLARSIRSPDGTMTAAILGVLDLDRFQDLTKAVSLKDSGSISIFHMDGALVARAPTDRAAIGRRYDLGPSGRNLTDASPEKTFRAVGPVDGQLRIGTMRKIPGFPLVVSASTTADSVLAAWSSQIRLLALITVAAIAVVALVLLFIAREMLSAFAKSERRVAREREKLDLAVNNMSQGLLLYDAHQRLEICNRSYLEMFGLSSDVIKPGCSFREVVSHRRATGSFTGDVEAYCTAIENDLAAGRVARMLVTAPNGRTVQMSNKRLSNGSWIMTMEDVTELQRSHARIAHLAMHDTLTGLPNRAQFRERLLAGLESAGRASLALLFVDLDNFKLINDTYGHVVGDALLCGVAARLAAAIPETDLVARLAGDEFAILQHNATQADAEALAGRILAALTTPVSCAGQDLDVNASVGVALSDPAITDVETLIRRADLAMYAAKAAGKRGWRVFERDMEERAQARRNLERDLRRALAGNQIEVHYQPIFDIGSRAVAGREALMRWRHPSRGMISPAEFIPMAEETHLIVELGRFILREACRQAALRNDGTYVAVNVSPIQLVSGHFALDTAAILASTGLRPDRLALEVTESVLMQDQENVLKTMRELTELGVHFVLDDFGTGYSSLSYLQRFPFHKIKIDRSFVSTLCVSKGSEQIVTTILALANSLGMTTTAEGVETEAQLEMLAGLGCVEAQGFLLGRPEALPDATGGAERSHVA